MNAVSRSGIRGIVLAIFLAVLSGPAPAATAAPAASVQAPAPDHPSPASGPLYVEYQQPMRIHNRFIVGGLLAYLGLVAGWLLILGKRRTTGLVLGGLVVAVGLFLMVAGLH